MPIAIGMVVYFIKVGLPKFFEKVWGEQQMTGTYTEITKIETDKDSYSPGETVWVSVFIKNLYSASVHIRCEGLANDSKFMDLDAWANPGIIYSFGGYFTMPNSGVTIHTRSYYEGSDGLWHFDDEMTEDVIGYPLPGRTYFATMGFSY